MRRKIRESEYAALAELRYRIRQFLSGSDDVARAAGLEPQHYQLLLAVRGFGNRQEASIQRLAERLHLKHHSVVGLVDRLEEHGFVRRERSEGDLRRVLVTLLPRGQRALERVVVKRLHELRESGHALVSALAAILRDTKPAHVRSPLPRVSAGRRKDARK
jgi:DNA-binding MarR family transcriptional regulator